MTSYDIIYGEFIENCSTDDINLPDTNEKKYNAIHSAIKKYNTRQNDSLEYNDLLEEVNRDLKDGEILILSHFLRLSFLENQLIHLSSTYSPFQKEIGIKNYQEASRNFKEMIQSEKNTIEQIIISTTDDYM